MDSTREPSSSSPVTPSQSPPEEDGILSTASGMAKEAALLFQSHRYQECVDVLNQIFQKKEDDPKVVHNIAVAEYYRDGCSDPKKLVEVLNKVKKRSEDLARASGEQTEAVSNSGSKGSMNNASHQSTNSNSIDFLYADDFDTSIATLNIGVVLYNLQEYAQALSVLEPLYQNIEPIEETTALHICLLILDIALACHDASKAADVIHYLEKTFGVGCMTSQGDNGSTQSCQPSTQAAKTAPMPTNLVSVDVSNLDSGVGTNASESSLVRTLSDETEYENLFSSLDIGGQTLSKSTASNDIGRSTERSSAVIDLKLKLHLYKVRLLLLTRNLKATKREVKSAMNIARGRDSSTALLLKSQLEYARGNHRKAIKLLMTSINRTEPGSSSIFFNNLGCIYHHLRKHSTSIFFFSRALESSLSMRSERPLKVASQDKSFHIVYNCGLQYLICGKPVVAAQCFRKASPMFYNQPLLWLRLAECSLLALEKGLLKSDGLSVNGEEVNVHIVGDGRWRQLIVEDAGARVRNLDSLKEVDLSSGDGQCKLALPFARQCLLNALHLLNSLDSALMKITAVSGSGEEESSQGLSTAMKNSSQRISANMDTKTSNMIATAAGANGDSKESKGSASSYVTIQNSVFAYDNLRRKEYLMIKQAVLADLAFVELSLENPLKSLAAARALLQLPDCSAIYAFLGSIYAAESLCRLNRLKEAAEHLSVYVSEGIDVRLPFNDEDSKKWRNEKDVDVEEPSNAAASKSIAGSGNSNTDESIVFMSAEEARGALFVNLAAMSAMQGNLEQAHKFALLAVSAIPSNPSAVLSAVYVDLLLGKAQDAIARLKQCRHLRFLSPGVTLSRPRS
ncbi:uncharacterized protein LOC116250140 isoform X1 [Nymphaea colorata]|nr:uncharacterized protein LOC116250140 isoform X1 [Nymphaea colorata]